MWYVEYANKPKVWLFYNKCGYKIHVRVYKTQKWVCNSVIFMTLSTILIQVENARDLIPDGILSIFVLWQGLEILVIT